MVRLMPKHLALCNSLPAGLDGVAFAVEMAAGQDGARTAPGWVQLMPRDQVTARDGQVFIFEPEMAVITGTKPARGWIVELAARPAGLFGRLDWLDDAVRAGPSADPGQSSFDRAEHLGQCPYRHAEFERLRRLESRPAILHPDPVGRTDRPRHSPQRRQPGKLRPPSKAGCRRPRGGNRQRRAAWPRGAAPRDGQGR